MLVSTSQQLALEYQLVPGDRLDTAMTTPVDSATANGVVVDSVVSSSAVAASAPDVALEAPLADGAHGAGTAAHVGAAINGTHLSDVGQPVQSDPAGHVEAVGEEPEEAARQQIRALIERTREMRPSSDADLLMAAYAFAHEKHEGQRRRTGEPFIEHPIAVAGILAELGMDDPTLAAGLLHDVPEDCGVTYDEMVRRFGSEVAQLVDGVTKLKRIDFTSQAEKQADNLRKLFLAMADDVRVIIIKLADRLHNMRTLDPFPDKRRREIAAETLQIFAPIAHRLGIWRVKWELEDRSFKFLEPEVYKEIFTKVQRTRRERAELVQHSIDQLQARLVSDGIAAEVTGRPKHFYSIYQKMIGQGLKFDAIHDLIALRVICKSEPDCYHALGVVHSLWKHVPDMFFDYISKPKANNYQSLHTKVLDAEGVLLEVQIRTREMHRQAEFGIAAHWRYKEGERTDAKFGDKLRWLRLVLELQSDTAGNAQDFLDSLRLDLSSEQVFTFTPRGNVIDLPQGSTPVDFAYRVHSEIGNCCTGAKVNGRIVPLSYKLHNGDICEILTSRSSKGPNLGWLDFVVTPHAKNRIKSYLRRQNFDVNYREGLERLEKVAQTERLRLGAVAGSETLLKQARALQYKSVNELMAAIGYGEVSAENILNRIRAELKQQVPASSPGDDTLSGVASSLLHRRVKHGDFDDTELNSGSLIFGIPPQRKRSGRGGRARPSEGELAVPLPGSVGQMQDDILFSLAKCCAPIPGDEVKGYITRGRGVTVHRSDCSNLKHYEQREPDRLLEAHWQGEQTRPYAALIAIEASDRVGLLLEISSVIAGRNINITGVNTYPLKHNRARLNIAVIITDVQQLSDVMQTLRNVSGVTEVHRV